jgi:tripartite-type tricarboxylate transporter receptor subunit TctC
LRPSPERFAVSAGASCAKAKVASTWAQAVKSPEMQALMEKQGMESYAAPPDETTRQIKASVDEYAQVIKGANITWKP